MRKINIENTKIHFSFTLYGRYYMNDGLLLSNGKNWKEILQTVLDQQHSTLVALHNSTYTSLSQMIVDVYFTFN
jgi:hypothetical protein